MPRSDTDVSAETMTTTTNHTHLGAGASTPAPLIPAPPPRSATIQERAEWWARYGADLNLELWHMIRSLGAWYKDNGPIRTSAGLVTKIPDGYEWDSDGVAQVMPELVSNVQVKVTLGHVITSGAYVGAMEMADRLCSIIDEEFCGAEKAACTYETQRVVDTTEANRVVREGGEAAAAILPYRKAKGKIGVEKPKPAGRQR